MSRTKPLIEIPPDVEAEMTPAVRAFVTKAFAQLEEQIAKLKDQIQKLTPRNSSLPPSTEHPHAKPERN
jgi:hypothetical protein